MCCTAHAVAHKAVIDVLGLLKSNTGSQNHSGNVEHQRQETEEQAQRTDSSTHGGHAADDDPLSLPPHGTEVRKSTLHRLLPLAWPCAMSHR